MNLLPASEVTLLLQDAGPLPNMADWCIKRRILKTHLSIDKDAQSILHSIALNTLKQVRTSMIFFHPTEMQMYFLLIEFCELC